MSTEESSGNSLVRSLASSSLGPCDSHSSNTDDSQDFLLVSPINASTAAPAAEGAEDPVMTTDKHITSNPSANRDCDKQNNSATTSSEVKQDAVTDGKSAYAVNNDDGSLVRSTTAAALNSFVWIPSFFARDPKDLNEGKPVAQEASSAMCSLREQDKTPNEATTITTSAADAHVPSSNIRSTNNKDDPNLYKHLLTRLVSERSASFSHLRGGRFPSCSNFHCLEEMEEAGYRKVAPTPSSASTPAAPALTPRSSAAAVAMTPQRQHSEVLTPSASQSTSCSSSSPPSSSSSSSSPSSSSSIIDALRAAAWPKAPVVLLAGAVVAFSLFGRASDRTIVGTL